MVLTGLKIKVATGWFLLKFLGEICLLVFVVSTGHLHSLVQGPVSLQTSIVWPSPSHSAISLIFSLFCLSLPLMRTYVIISDPPGKSRIIFPSESPDQEFDSSCNFNSPLPWSLTFSQDLELGGRSLLRGVRSSFCLPQFVYSFPKINSDFKILHLYKFIVSAYPDKYV